MHNITWKNRMDYREKKRAYFSRFLDRILVSWKCSIRDGIEIEMIDLNCIKRIVKYKRMTII